MNKNAANQEPTEQDLDTFMEMMSVLSVAVLSDFVNCHDEGEAIATTLNSSQAYRDMMEQVAYSTLRMSSLALNEDYDPAQIVDDSMDGIESESGRAVELRNFIFDEVKHAQNIWLAIKSGMPEAELEARIAGMRARYNHSYNLDHVETEEA